MQITSDRGSDCFSAGHCLAYAKEFKLNVTLWWDNSHDAYRGVLESIRKGGHYSFIIMVMVIINLDHGPDDCGMRYGQMLGLANKSAPCVGLVAVPPLPGLVLKDCLFTHSLIYLLIVLLTYFLRE